MKREARIQQLCSELIKRTTAHGGEISWLDQLVGNAIRSPQLRTQVLRFIDVLPSLENDIELTHHLQEYFGDLDPPLPELARWGLKQSDKPWLSHIAAPLVRFTTRSLSRKFMGGSSISSAANTVSKLQRNGMHCSLDILGEACISEKEADDYQHAYLQMIPAMSAHMRQGDTQEISTKDINLIYGREVPRLNVSLKLSSLYSQIDAVSTDASIKAIKNRLYPILECAREHDAFVTIDMEQYDFKNIILQTFIDTLQEKTFENWPNIGLAMQAYLKNSYQDLQSIYAVLQNRKTPATIRLVRGAYWDYETVIARQNNWPSPVWTKKQDTDANFERCLDFLLSKYPVFETAIATHNTRSIAATIAIAETYNLSKDDYEFQMLHGMADTLKQVIVQNHHHLRVYIPYGEILPGMAYLVRRLLENSSGQSILDIGLSRQQPINLDKPAFSSPSITDHSASQNSIESLTEANRIAKNISAGDSSNKKLPFRNQALCRFCDESERHSFQRAIHYCQSQLGKTYPLIIGGQEYFSDETIESINPAKPDEIIGSVSAAKLHFADLSIDRAKQAHHNWSRRSFSDRANWLRIIANKLNEQSDEFAAWQVLEAGKNWREADADVCEAIDFLNYYAEQAEKFECPAIAQSSGELNIVRYHSRGVGLVIPPWNFPLAIMVGMLSATIVTGNTAIVKPSSQTPVIAARFVELIHQCGLPEGVVNLVTGSGSQIGSYLAKHKDIHIIAFTGSMAVGKGLIAIGAQVSSGQTHIKRVIAEMGGKNAIIIDDDADLDVAVTGTVNSAFGFQGQKCSAASRVIVLDHIYDAFLERLIETSKSITIGPPLNPENTMGPVISQPAETNILKAIEQAKQEATLLLGGSAATVSEDFKDSFKQGYYIAPTIFTEVTPDSTLAQKEIFGPVLAVMRTSNFEQAIKIANHSSYALTGGVYSRNPHNLNRAKNEFNVGNLYLNRKITGALVSRQPFGGYKLSGIGYKAGGDNYLLQFMHASCITENTMRRGFSPEENRNLKDGN